MVSRSGGTTKRQFAWAMATTSPEPCQGIGETRGDSGGGEGVGWREPGSPCSSPGAAEAVKAAAGLPHSIMGGGGRGGAGGCWGGGGGGGWVEGGQRGWGGGRRW